MKCQYLIFFLIQFLCSLGYIIPSILFQNEHSGESYPKPPTDAIIGFGVVSLILSFIWLFAFVFAGKPAKSKARMWVVIGTVISFLSLLIAISYLIWFALIPGYLGLGYNPCNRSCISAARRGATSFIERNGVCFGTFSTPCASALTQASNNYDGDYCDIGACTNELCVRDVASLDDCTTVNAIKQEWCQTAGGQYFRFKENDTLCAYQIYGEANWGMTFMMGVWFLVIFIIGVVALTCCSHKFCLKQKPLVQNNGPDSVVVDHGTYGK